jgi:hypothetical protein
MFNFFRKKETPPRPATGAENPDNAKASEAAWIAALRAQIDSRKAADPLIGPKIGAKEINKRLMAGLKNEKGIHIESFLTVLGALAGFSCQMSLREELSKRTGMETEKIVWTIVNGADGKKYHFGDALNKPLAESQYSVWSLVAGATQKLGATAPDINEIFKHVAATAGGSTFGMPRIPDNHRPGDLPINYLKVIWPRIFPVAAQFCDTPSEWPILFGLAAQEAIFMAKDVIDPRLAATIVMECAIPMSKVDLPEFYTSTNNLGV